MIKKSITFFLFILCFFTIDAQSTPQQILNKAISSIVSAKGVEAKFTIYNSGYSGTGEIKSLGKKFHVILPDVEVWYNGKDLYTYNKRISETTVVTPTPEELSESNPLAYVSGASDNYNVAFSTVKKAGSEVLELTPKKRSEIKRITLTLKKTDSAPEKIVVEPKNGNPIRADIGSFKTGMNFSESEFNYPESKYPKVEIVDLR